MGKKKNKTKHKVAQHIPIQNQGFPPLTEEQKRQATQRLTNLFKTIGAEPESILDMLVRLEIPWRRSILRDTDGSDTEYILIRSKDLEAGDARNKAAGSLASRIYKDADNSNSIVSHNNSRNNNSNVDTSVPDVIPRRGGLDESTKENLKAAAAKFVETLKQSQSDNEEYRRWKATQSQGVSEVQSGSQLPAVEPFPAVEPAVQPAVNDDLTEDYLRGMQG